MCIFSQQVESVSNTKIFVGLSPRKNRQLTVYSNAVSNVSAGNAMIIPVPYPHTVSFHDFSTIKDFFNKVDKSFYRQNLSRAKGISTNSVLMSHDSLEVMRVGDYNVSLAKSLGELNNINTTVFSELNLSSEVKSLLEKRYGSQSPFPWGFIIFGISADRENKSYSPFAFSHCTVQESNKAKVYIPTYHYHKHKPAPTGATDFVEDLVFNTVENYLFGPSEMADDWSHSIYLFNCGQSNVDILNRNQAKYGCNMQLYFDRKLIDFDLSVCDNFEKFKVEGKHENMDIYIPIQSTA